MPKEIKIQKFEQYKGSIYTYTMDTTLIDQTLSVTSSAVDWSTEDTSVVSLGTESFAGGVASCPITASSVGTAIIKLAITTDSDDAPIAFIEINVSDPES